MVADDTPAVVDAFEAAIRKLGHTAVTCRSLRAASSIINNRNNPLDIVFLDNHFKHEGYGIDEIRTFRSVRPDLDIVITTKYAVAPALVRQVVEMQVGFSPKEVVDPVRLELEIAQRVNSRLSSQEAFRAKLKKMREMAEEGKEGFFRVFKFKGKPRCDLTVDAIQKTNETIIVPAFELFQTVGIGQTVEVSHEFEFEVADALKASTEYELGLGLEESVKFFGTEIGGQIKSRLKSQFAVDHSKRVKSAYKIGQKLTLTGADEQAGIRKREYYRGIEHRIFRAKLRANCRHCGSGSTISVQVFVPYKIVEVSVAYDKMGMRLPDEDGRIGYRQLEIELGESA
jgi:hypothetical protein